MQSYYDQRHTYEDIEKNLKKIKQCVKARRYTISLNEHRSENISFIQTYQLTSKKQRQLLLEVMCKDFAHTLHNTKTGYEHEELYVFAPHVKVYGIDGIERSIPVYLKFNLIEADKQNQKGNYLVVVSIHECKKQIQYPFK